MNSNKHGKVQVVLIYLPEEVSISNAQVLLLQMNDERGAHWQSVTGSVDPGENFEQAAKRELIEETGVNADIIELDLNFEFHDRWGKDVFEKVYLAKVKSIPKVVISSDEHQNYKWVNLDDISQKSFGYPSNYQAYLKALEVLN